MGATEWAQARAAFEEAAEWFVAMAGHAVGRWDEPGLGEWSVRDLVGHAGRALLTVEAYLQTHPAQLEVASTTAYFERVLASPADDAAVAERGRQAGAALGGDPV